MEKRPIFLICTLFLLILSTLIIPDVALGTTRHKLAVFHFNVMNMKASGYKVYRAFSKSGPFINFAQVTQSQYCDVGLESNR